PVSNCGGGLKSGVRQSADSSNTKRSAPNTLPFRKLVPLSPGFGMSRSSVNYDRMLLVGVGLPAVLAAADHSILTTISIAEIGVPSIALLFTFFAVQIWLVSWTVARFISPWPLRWF